MLVFEVVGCVEDIHSSKGELDELQCDIHELSCGIVLFHVHHEIF